jgi:hypothetical protein
MTVSSLSTANLIGMVTSLWTLLPLFSVPTDATQVFLQPVEADKKDIHWNTLINTFQWLLVENNIGSYEGSIENPPEGCGPTDDGYPDACEWPSIRFAQAHAPIYGSGDDSEWNDNTSLEIQEPAKYMVTIQADGYRLCGGYFEVKGDELDPIVVKPVCQKFPLELGTIRLFAFHDNAPCNGQYDPGEEGLFDFGIGVNDIEGAVTNDYYGNDLQKLVTDENGILTVENMWPTRYDIDVGAPPGEGWIKTNTLEGGHGWDYWLYEGWDGYDNEFVLGGERFPMMTAGFIKLHNDWPQNITRGYRRLTGQVVTATASANGMNFQEIVTATVGNNANKKGPLWNEDGIVAINSVNEGDVTKAVIKCDADGYFNISLPPGDYNVVYFDVAQQFIVNQQTVTVPRNKDVNMGELFLFGWFSTIEGHFFHDENGNGVFDGDEQGVADAGFPVFRLRDGTQIDRGLQFDIPFSDPERVGFYSIKHVYPLAQWMALHTFHPRWEITGCKLHETNEQERMNQSIIKTELTEFPCIILLLLQTRIRQNK